MNNHDTPHTIGIIMDGNRRWAKSRSMESFEGHAAGKQKLKDVLAWSKQAGVEHLICYAFSTENWNRPPEEIHAIESILVAGLKSEVDELAKEGIRIRFLGDRSRYDESVQQLMGEAEAKTASGTHTLGVALSYGGRTEIVEAARQAAKEGEISESSIARNLYTAGIPEPELIIRTGGQHRLSNFLLWQSAYSELYFLDTLWPDFSPEEFQAALDWYAATKRNFGK